MENNLDKFLKEQFSPDEITVPNLEGIAAARKKVALRKPQAEEQPGFFSGLSGFFNLQIKLYQAALATLVIVGYIYFFTKKDVQTKETIVTQYVTERATSTTTVLASIFTFITRQ
jgi:hypothetical protein